MWYVMTPPAKAVLTLDLRDFGVVARAGSITILPD
jgi:hypothetical protein